MTSEARKRAKKKYERSEKGKQRIRIYRRSWKGKAVRRRWYIKLKKEVFSHYGGSPPQCECCRESHIEFLEIDHVYGGGSEHRRELNNKGGKSFYVWLRVNKWPTGYRVLCSNCNQAYGAFGYCPHKKEVDNQSTIVSSTS